MRKTSTDYMREKRAKLRVLGFVPKEVWVLPENTGLLGMLELKLRHPVEADGIKMEKVMHAENWNIAKLAEALSTHELVSGGKAGLTVVEGADQTIQLSMNELGGLPIFIAVTGEQIIVDTILVEAGEVTDLAAFNAAVLRSRDLLPLSSIGLETLPSGEDVYSIFGALSSGSSLANVITEIETLVENIQRATEIFQDMFVQESN
ncbi:YjfI family protein [Pseudomonas aeruginosa]|jgi:hypothetical protein|uniref:DUF2170 domain-containing protein n=1 Tax=Pseudomonas saponiphila TaxID=556534 RepID=A0A1H4ZPB0_9PSED|nr:YjfI family protein [Pseudomonas saponiphila]SED31498.1 hypothetical protein SAMN05216178_6747 [Pseudomonas saponiphila]